MSKLFKNILFNLSGQSLVLVVGFIAVKYIFTRLGAEALGIIYFTSGLNQILSAVFELGGATAVKEVSSYFGIDNNYVRKFIRTFSLYYWAIYAFVALAIFFLAPFFAFEWINLSLITPESATGVLRILGITLFLALPSSFYSSLIRGLQKMHITNFIEVFSVVLQQTGAIAILFFGGRFFDVVAWFAFCYVLRAVIFFSVCSHFFSFSAMGPKLYIEVIRKNFKFTLGTTLISILNIIHTQADKIFISKLLPVSDLGYYSVAYTGVSKGTLLTNAVSEATYPSFSSLAKSDNRDLLMHQYHRLQDFICFIILPVFAAVPFAIVPLFSFIFNPEVAYSLLLPMTFVSVGFYMNGTTMIPYIFSLAVDRPDITVKMNFYALFIILPIAATFVYFFGILGAGFSWLCYNVFLYIYSMPRICKECLRIKTSVWYKHVLRILFSGLFIYGISWLMLVFIKNYSILVLSIVYIISSVAFLFSAYFLISKQLRETIIYYLKLILKPEAYGQ